ncbi:MAG TPA: TadE/TadG family type IV pilus assembly protein [Acidimicrobiales bacterium]|nr:TadE/TadG family type IV pilus assembly protein [Acidimicrobiales bacterium]
MTPQTQREGRAAAVELALFTPLLVLLLLAALGVTEYVADRRHLSYVTEQAARFAAGRAPEPGSPRPPGVRPTPEAVAAYVAEISDLPLVEVTVTPDPALLFPGAPVTVGVTLHHDIGPIADIADTLAGLIGHEQDLSEEGIELQSTVTEAKQ